MLSEYDKEHIDEIMAGQGDWFTAQLLRLIHKADYHHRPLLALSFPKEVQAVENWENDG